MGSIKSCLYLVHFDITSPDKTGEQWWGSFFEKFEPLFEKYQISSPDRENIKTRFIAQILGFDHYVLYDLYWKHVSGRGIKIILFLIIIRNWQTRFITLDWKSILRSALYRLILAMRSLEKKSFRALEKAGYPEVCYMIGDNPVADILGGKAAGMRTILVHHEDRHEEDHNCKVLAEIPELLEDSV